MGGCVLGYSNEGERIPSTSPLCFQADLLAGEVRLTYIARVLKPVDDSTIELNQKNVKLLFLARYEVNAYCVVMEFSEKVRGWRKKVGLTQTAASQLFGISLRAYQSWEKGDYEPQANVCLKCAETKMAPSLESIDPPTNPATQQTGLVSQKALPSKTAP